MGKKHEDEQIDEVSENPAEGMPAASLADDRPDDWFEGDATVANDLPRYAIGDPLAKDAENPEKILMQLEGTYEETTAELVQDKLRLIHRIKGRELVGGHPRIEVWGNAAIDKILPTLMPGSKVRLLYIGTIKVKGRKVPMKDIRVEYSLSAKRRPNPFGPKGTAQ